MRIMAKRNKHDKFEKPIFTKRDIYRILGKIYKTIRENPESIKIKKIPRLYMGLYWPDTDEIEVDYRCPILSVFIHEMIHKIFPEKSETWVLKAESRIINQISYQQAKNLLKALCSIL